MIVIEEQLVSTTEYVTASEVFEETTEELIEGTELTSELSVVDIGEHIASMDDSLQLILGLLIVVVVIILLRYIYRFFDIFF